MADDKKVFDVAKPGSSKPDTGSKPMVVGHKIMKDPTINDKQEDSTVEEQPIVAQSSKITINPVSEEFVESNKETETSPPEEAAVSTEDSKEDETPAAVSSTEDKTEESPKSEDKSEPVSEEDKKENEAEEEIQREENLQKIIKEKTYNLPIEEASYSAAKTFLKTFLVVGIIGIITIVLLIDAEVIDLGITLPFDFL